MPLQDRPVGLGARVRFWSGRGLGGLKRLIDLTNANYKQNIGLH